MNVKQYEDCFYSCLTLRAKNDPSFDTIVQNSKNSRLEQAKIV